MVEEFYTHFRYECWSMTEDRTIGLAYFDQIRVHYPTTAVLKVFRNKAAGHREFSSALLCQSLHRHVLRLYAYYETPQYSVLFLEHCEGGALSSSLSSFLQSKESILLDMMDDIAQTVAALHSHSIVHRDLKPHNVFLTSNHVCKLGDFETVKELGSFADLRTLPKGTVAYMSPEKANSLIYREALEPNRAFLDDIWALGKTFFEMGIGRVDQGLAGLAATGRPAVHSYIFEALRGAGRSENLAILVEDMLTSSEITAKDVCRTLSRLKAGAIAPVLAPKQANTPKCVLCSEEISLISLPCKHNYCLSHFSQHISLRLSPPSTTLLAHITCLRCPSPIPYDILARSTPTLPPELHAKLRRIDSLSASLQCTCGLWYPLVQWKQEVARTYVWECRKCGVKVCSWCGSKGGHGLFSSTAKCPSFPY